MEQNISQFPLSSTIAALASASSGDYNDSLSINNLLDKKWQLSALSCVFIGVETFLLLFITMGNMLVIVSILKYIRLRTCTNSFLLSLAFADLGVGVSMPLHISLYASPALLTSKYVCLLRYTTIILGCSASMLSLLLVALDRLLAVVYPLKHDRVFTKSNVVYAIVAVWVLSGIYAAIPFLGWHTWDQYQLCVMEYILSKYYLYIFIIAQFVILTAAIIFIYIRIYLSTLQLIKVSPEIVTEREQKLFVLREKQQTKFVFVVLGTFLACWCPFMILTIVEIELRPPEDGVVNLFSNLAVFLGILNSGMNPIIYNFFSKEFKLAFRKLLRVKYHGMTIPDSMMLESHSVSLGNKSRIVRECMSVNNIKSELPPRPTTNKRPSAVAGENYVTGENILPSSV